MNKRGLRTALWGICWLTLLGPCKILFRSWINIFLFLNKLTTLHAIKLYEYEYITRIMNLNCRQGFSNQLHRTISWTNFCWIRFVLEHPKSWLLLSFRLPIYPPLSFNLPSPIGFVRHRWPIQYWCFLLQWVSLQNIKFVIENLNYGLIPIFYLYFWSCANYTTA